MNRIEITITGSATRTVDIHGNETLADLVNRLDSPDFKLRSVQTWYADGVPVGSASSHRLHGGMSVMGTPKVDGGLG